MTNFVIYESKNAKPYERWLAYAVLPDGNQWLVRCTGETEEVALIKARKLYENELVKMPTQFKQATNEPAKNVSFICISTETGEVLDLTKVK